MYRYQKQNRINQMMRSNRLRSILILLAVIVATFLIFRLVGGGGLDEGNFENHRNAKLRNEMQHAINQTNSLSRLGSTSTSNVLGKVRQHVHGIDVINDLNVSMYGEVGRLYEETVFTNIYSIIEAYDAKLASGQKVNDSQAALMSAIESLNQTTEKILGNN